LTHAGMLPEGDVEKMSILNEVGKLRFMARTRNARFRREKSRK